MGDLAVAPLKNAASTLARPIQPLQQEEVRKTAHAWWIDSMKPHH